MSSSSEAVKLETEIHTADETKKRAHQDGNDVAEALSNKRIALSSSSNDPDPDADLEMFLKVLIPNPIAGLLIGKQGVTINTMTESSGCRIRLSGNNTFYPGTNERLVLLSGTKSAIIMALELVTEKVAESMFSKSIGGEKEIKKDPVASTVEMGPTSAKVPAPGIYCIKKLSSPRSNYFPISPSHISISPILV